MTSIPLAPIADVAASDSSDEPPTTTLRRNGRVSIPDGVMARELEGELVLLNLDSESYFGLDDVGTRMWSVLTNSESIETAYETLLVEYDVEPERLRMDLCDFIDKLSESGLIDVRED